MSPAAESDLVFSEASPSDQLNAVKDLCKRVLPEYQHLFSLAIVPPGTSSYFSVEVIDGTIHIQGTTGIELASGVNWFLKYFCNSSISWNATGGRQLDVSCFSPERMLEHELRGPVRIDRIVPHSYYQNIVTMSYSFTYWEWDRWEQEIDWMALQGINLPLAPAGIEAVWLATYQQLGLSSADLQDFFPGPSFLAWGRMGNIQGYAGPLPLDYMQRQAQLQKRIVQRMRQFGMTPVFPAFAGFVPSALVRKFPQAQVTRCSNWAHFPEPYCCPHLLLPSDPLYATIGTAYIRNLRAMYGHDRKGYYTADTFNEMRPTSAAADYLRGVSASVYGAMAAADPSAVWLMQAWLFFSDRAFWQPQQIQALLSGVPRGKLILLDLFAEEHPVWERTESFYGYPFIWCMLHNFGGNLETYGALSNVQEGVSRALAAASGSKISTMVGIGMAPEGIEQNPMVYDYMAEMAFKGRHALPLGQWVQQYSSRRYGGAGGAAAAASLQQAWQLLLRCSYTCTDHIHNTVCDIPTSRPGLSATEIVGWGLRPHYWCRVADVGAAWKLLLAAGAAGGSSLAGSCAYQYDLLDVGREFLSKLSTSFWQGVVEAYQAGNARQVADLAAGLTGLLGHLDTLLASHKAFLLGPRLQQARAYAQGDASLAALYEANLRRQLTVWGTSAAAGDSEVSDYANRQWAGLISTFYLPRWQLWLQRLQQDLAQGRAYEPEAWRRQVLEFTFAWIDDSSSTAALPLQPAGEPLDLSRRLFHVYGLPVLQQQLRVEELAAARAAEAAAGPGVAVLEVGVAADS